jgi:Spy/CpxP family protein refolding chaperone
MKFELLISLLSLSLLFSPSLSVSQPFPPGMEHRPGMGMMHRRGESPCFRASDLDLSPDQMKELELLQQSFYRDTQPLRTELFSKYFELKESLTNPVTKIESIQAKNSEIILLQSKLEEKTIQYLIKVRALLTQEQLKVWCPEQEVPPLRRMMHGPGLMGPMPPRKPEKE